MTIGKDYSDFLNTNMMASAVATAMVEKLWAFNSIPRVAMPAGTNAVEYEFDAYNALTDPKVLEPMLYSDSAEVPQIEVSGIGTKTARTVPFRFKFKLNRSAMLQKDIDWMTRALKRAGYIMAYVENTNILSSITAGVEASTVTPSKVWSDAAATPVLDLLAMKHEMDTEGYAFGATDVFINTENYNEFEKYLLGGLSNIDYAKQSALYGKPEPIQKRKFVPGADIFVNGVFSGIKEGAFLTMDMNSPPATCYYWTDPKYGIESVQYLAKGFDGTVSTKSTDALGLNISVHEEPDTHDTIVTLWRNTVAVVREPKAGRYKASGI